MRGRWDVNCPKEYIAYIRPLPGMKYAPNVVLPDVDQAMAPRALAPLPALVSRLWTETGGNLRGRVVETDARLPQHRGVSTAPAWSSEFSVPLSQVVREINKTSDNVAARSLLLSLGSGSQLPGEARQSAKNRVHEWLRKQGLVDGDIRVDLGSGQVARGARPPARDGAVAAQRLEAEGAQAFVNSLPIAGFDGTLVNRMKGGGRRRRGLPEDRHPERHPRAGWLRAQPQRQGLRGDRHRQPRRGRQGALGARCVHCLGGQERLRPEGRQKPVCAKRINSICAMRT